MGVTPMPRSLCETVSNPTQSINLSTNLQLTNSLIVFCLSPCTKPSNILKQPKQHFKLTIQLISHRSVIVCVTYKVNKTTIYKMYIKFAYKMIIVYCIIEFILQVLKLQAAIKYGEEDLQGAKV